MHKLKFLTISIVVLLLLSAAVPMSPQPYGNPAAVNLLSVSNYAALASTAVSSPAGGTNLNNGDLGITGVGCTNFPLPCTTPLPANGVVNGGAIQNNNGVATTGQTDATAVVTDLNGRLADATIGSGLLTGLTLDQGVYDVTSVGGGGDDLTGPLTLRGDANSIFIFRFNDTFITSGTASILFSGGVRSCNVYWTSTAATFAGTTQMVGTVFGATSVTFPGGAAVLNGRVIAQTAAITFNNTTINNQPICLPVDTGGESNEVRGLPNTGGAPIQNGDFPWSLAILGGISVIALGLGLRAYRRNQLPK